MAELVDARDLKSRSSNGVRVRFPPWAPLAGSKKRTARELRLEESVPGYPVGSGQASVVRAERVPSQSYFSWCMDSSESPFLRRISWTLLIIAFSPQIYASVFSGSISSGSSKVVIRPSFPSHSSSGWERARSNEKFSFVSFSKCSL